MSISAYNMRVSLPI